MALMPVAEALRQVLAGGEPLATETVALDDALGRTLAQDLAAKRTQPPDDVSAMDGYAVRAADTASEPATLTVIGEVAAGHPFQGTVGPRQAARIFTGGVVPEGADCVVIQEVTERDGDRVTIKRSGIKGKHIRRKGIDFREGEALLSRGRRLDDRDLMLAASMNYPRVEVYRRPKVAIVGTGDELVMPGTEPRPGEIVYSNGFALTALARGEGAEARDFGIARDRLDDIAAYVRRARDWGADILVTSGGASVGEHDLVQRALKAEGLDLSFWRVALRPGRPMMHGRLGRLQVLGVPGNPVSSYVCSVLFLVPLIRKLSGRADLERPRETARLGRDLPANDEREDYLRAVLTFDPDGPVATPVSSQDSSLMAPLSRSGCLVIRPPNAPAAATGSSCVILKLAF
ncbi:MAG TPA: gephyrin-like molybdotransferase Glp [Pseudolabrys sp.]|nr:gephyrin-like molybdotransferase Glp [Pseudolabrys sp.]